MLRILSFSLSLLTILSCTKVSTEEKSSSGSSPKNKVSKATSAEFTYQNALSILEEAVFERQNWGDGEFAFYILSIRGCNATYIEHKCKIESYTFHDVQGLWCDSTSHTFSFQEVFDPFETPFSTIAKLSQREHPYHEKSRLQNENTIRFNIHQLGEVNHKVRLYYDEKVRGPIEEQTGLSKQLGEIRLKENIDHQKVLRAFIFLVEYCSEEE